MEKRLKNKGPKELSTKIDFLANDILQALPIAVLRLNKKGEVLFANSAGRAILGIAGTKAVSLRHLVEGLGRSVDDWLADAFFGRNLKHPEILRLSKKNRDNYVQITLDQFQPDGAKELLAVIVDATGIKSLEAQLVQSQKMDAIGQLAGGIAHDFNNILTAILGYTDLVLENSDESRPEWEDINQIKANADRAVSLVRQLLAFSRKQSLRPVQVDLRMTLTNLAQLLNRLVGEKIHISQHHDPWLRFIKADPLQIEQVIMNLVVNACDAMPGGGKIEIRTENIHLSRVLRRDQAVLWKGDYVKITVADTGTGIGPKELPRIFEPFFTTKETGKGTGLGLSTVYGIIKQSGGFVFVDSPQKGGAIFEIYLPVSLENFTPKKIVGEKSAKISPHSKSILLVEDEESVRMLVSKALRRKGYSVIEVASGTNALKLLDDEMLQIDLLISDVVMPGLDGPAWIKTARQKHRHIKAILISGYAQESLNVKIKELGNVVFLQKPFPLEILMKTIAEIVP